MNTIEERFHNDMLDIYQKVGRATGYWAYRYLAKVKRDGGVEAARYWIRKKDVSAGFARLEKMGMLDYAMENLVLKPQYRPLFNVEERTIAYERLKKIGHIK